ncbi:SGNH/GDSL hydrolase family protein [uncultured Algibacter sp.]|uniref:SGNH/GDSL hydrolase family protein n=1 Tax=uncultured Algibacter sp. TaxID=298659 RepID=UPI002612F701|nr:SGNH/GDSL hydrolase family protein [uncultured Algibacter sp.]
MKNKTPIFILLFSLLFTCNVNENRIDIIEQIEEESPPTDTEEENDDNNGDGNEGDDSDDGDDQEQTQITYKILALGDSYTIGASVCDTCRFPEQLKDSLVTKFESDTSFELKVIARTGWTTTSLINAIDNENIVNDYNLVSLLIGVNNQYQGKPFSLYETEFPELVNTAISIAANRKSKVLVISIPDYAYTPFGRGNPIISAEIDTYNTFAKNYCTENNISYINITDITRMGLENTALVASDGLHPSKLAYSKFVERILPVALDKLKD